jgi:hypothetical protein
MIMLTVADVLPSPEVSQAETSCLLTFQPNMLPFWIKQTEDLREVSLDDPAVRLNSQIPIKAHHLMRVQR